MCPYRRYKTVRQVAYEREHAVVHVINRYRARVDMALREQHGNLYEWEIMADCESIALLGDLKEEHFDSHKALH
jgi:hypothetical protein